MASRPSRPSPQRTPAPFSPSATRPVRRKCRSLPWTCLRLPELQPHMTGSECTRQAPLSPGAIPCRPQPAADRRQFEKEKTAARSHEVAKRERKEQEPRRHYTGIAHGEMGLSSRAMRRPGLRQRLQLAWEARYRTFQMSKTNTSKTNIMIVTSIIVENEPGKSRRELRRARHWLSGDRSCGTDASRSSARPGAAHGLTSAPRNHFASNTHKHITSHTSHQGIQPHHIKRSAESHDSHHMSSQTKRRAS